MPSITYNANDTFPVPAGVTSITFDVKAAAGGDGPGSIAGGLGGRVQGTIPVTSLENLTILVGGLGVVTTGGTNGGGEGGASSAGGGGRSGIKRDATILVEAGAGGGGGNAAGYTGGAGGDTTAAQGSGLGPGFAGTPTAGGAAGSFRATAGSAGVGGIGSVQRGGGGGGGGYYGGGGADMGGGGGGSSYTDASVTGVIHTQGYQAGAGQVIISWITPPKGASMLIGI